MNIEWDGEILTVHEPPTGKDIDLQNLYFRDISYLSKLSEERVAELMAQFQAGDPFGDTSIPANKTAAEAREALILSLLGVVGYFLPKFKNLDRSDLISTVNMTIVSTVDSLREKWDPTTGNLSAYVLQRVNWDLLKLSRDSRSVVYMPPQTEKSPYRSKLPRDVSMDAPIWQKHEPNSLTYADVLADPTAKTPEHLLGTKEGRARLKDLLSSHVTPGQYKVLALATGLDDGEFHTFPEIAALLHSTYDAVKSKHYRALQRLRAVPSLKELLHFLTKPDQVK